ncbi:MAG: trigger factor [Herbinix sp.]|jgi:trigger factor|nr:trigger factor [Herbinix sp.]
MKKKLLFLVMSLSIVMLAWGCGKKNVTEETEVTPTGTVTEAPAETDTETTEGATETPVEAPVKEAYEVSDYITLGEYKGLPATYTKLEVTDADIDTAIKGDLEENAADEEVTDRAVQTGDVVNIDYEGLKDGVAFEGGTAQAFDLEIGSGSFIPGFEEGLVGAKVGDELSLDLSFPADYSAAELAGQAVVFKVKVNSIKVSVVPELTEEFVKNNTDFENIAAYKEGTRAELVKANDDTMRNEKIKNLITAIVDGSKISSYPQSVVDFYAFEMESYYQQYASMFGYELADFLAANGLTEEKYAEEKKAYAEDRTAQELVLNAIIKAEKMELTDEEYKAGVASYIEEYGYASEEEFFQYATEGQIKESLIWEKAVDFILAQSKEA